MPPSTYVGMQFARRIFVSDDDDPKYTDVAADTQRLKSAEVTNVDVHCLFITFFIHSGK